MVPREDIVELDISVEAGLKLILSTGVVVPDELTRQALQRREMAREA